MCAIAILSGSMIYASRVVGNIYGDDFFTTYYPLYQAISLGEESFFSSGFGGGVEFGLPLVFKIISLILPDESQAAIMVFISFFCLFLFYVWIEKFFVKEINSKYISLSIASAFLFLVFSYDSVSKASNIYSICFILCFLL